VRWGGFGVDSALERDLLRRALPLVPTSSDTSNRSVLDQATGVTNHSVAATTSLGPAAESCIDLLAIRPLLTGAAWKVLDLLFEAALDEAEEIPVTGRNMSIANKSRLAAKQAGRPSGIGPTLWGAICEVYVGTIELRHSLVHRGI